MINNAARKSRFPIAAALVLLFAAALPNPALADAPAQTPAPVDRRKIIDLCEKDDLLDALPGLRELNQRDPDDHQVSEDLALALLLNTHNGENDDQQKATRIEARNILLDAKKRGDDSNLLVILLEQLPEDGSSEPFSDRKEVNDAMQLGELEFARGKLEDAIKHYQQAYKLEPKLYVAALFTGDMYFRLNKQVEAGEWFDRAIKIDPNVETGYRYWGDALMKDGKITEARDKFVDAVVANPYRSSSWIGLDQWAHKSGAVLSMPKWKPVDADGDNKADALMSKAYRATRDDWKTAKFKKEFPKAAAYRRSLKEEVEALSGALDALDKMSKEERGDLSEQTQMLRKIQKAGLIEPFALLSEPDAGTAQDYGAFRDANRDKLRQFIKQFIIGKDDREH